MELIKQIKDAETTAKTLIGEAQKYAVQVVENAGRLHIEQFVKMQQERRNSIETAESDGQKQGIAESEQLKTKSSQTKQMIEQKANAKMEIAVKTVIDFIKKQD